MANSRVQKFKRNLILQSASMLFADSSYESVTVDDIAKAAGFSKASVYTFFSSKDEILFYVLRDELENYCAEMQKIIDHADDALAALDQVITMYCRSFWKRSRLMIHFFSRCKNENKNENFKEEWYEEIKDLKKRRTGLMAAILADGIQKKMLYDNQSPFDMARILEAMVRGVGMSNFIGNKGDSPEDMETAIKIIYHGIICQNRREKIE